MSSILSDTVKMSSALGSGSSQWSERKEVEAVAGWLHFIFFSIKCVGFFFPLRYTFIVLLVAVQTPYKKKKDFFLPVISDKSVLQSEHWFTLKAEIYHPYTWCIMHFHNSPMLVKKGRPNVFTFKEFLQCFLILPWAWDL